VLKVASYLRVSTEEQAEQNISIPGQKSRQIAYCQAKQWEIYDFYIDNGFSGKDLDRPEMKRLMVDAKNKLFDIVLVVKLDRLSRRQQHVMYLLEEIFEPNRISFSSVSENFETNTTMGKAMLGIMAVFAQLERETIVQRVTDAKKDAATQGRFMGGPPPYGYKHNKITKSLEIDEIESDIVRFIFNEYLKTDKGFQYIAETLTQNKTPTRTGVKHWNPTTIRGIIKNPLYAGYIPHKGELHKGKHNAIITREQWDDSQKITLGRNYYDHEANNGLLKGFTVCGECGAIMRAKRISSKGYTYYYYICYSQEKSTPSMIKDENCKCGYHKTDVIENKVIEKLMNYSLKPEMLIKAAQKEIKGQDNSHIDNQIPALIKELSDTKKRISKWQDAFEVDAITLDEMKERTDELKNKRHFLESKISECQNSININNRKIASIQSLVDRMSKFPIMWEKATNEEKRSILLTIIKKVLVFKDHSVSVNLFEDLSVRV
jgi:site-specific DNA recombinase